MREWIKSLRKLGLGENGKMEDSQEFRLDFRKIIPFAMLSSIAMAIFAAGLIVRPDVWQAGLGLVIAAGALAFQTFYFVRFRVRVTEAGIETGYWKPDFFEWKDVIGLERRATRVGALAKQKAGLALVGKNASGQTKSALLPFIEMRPGDAKQLEAIVIEKTGLTVAQ
jgi:hypothetical protein